MVASDYFLRIRNKMLNTIQYIEFSFFVELGRWSNNIITNSYRVQWLQLYHMSSSLRSSTGFTCFVDPED